MELHLKNDFLNESDSSEKLVDKSVWIFAAVFSHGSFLRQNKFVVKVQQHFKNFNNLAKDAGNVFYHLSTPENCRNTKLIEISQHIIKQELQDKDINLYLLTNGEMNETDIIECKNVNLKINFKKLFLVNISEEYKDNSIAFAFLNPNCKITMTEELADETRTIEIQTSNYDFEEITTVNLPEKFEELLNYVIINFSINNEKLAVGDAMKDNLDKELLEFVRNIKKKKVELITALQNNRNSAQSLYRIDGFIKPKNEIIDGLKNLKFYKDLVGERLIQEDEIVVKLDSLIAYINDTQKVSFSFVELKKKIMENTFDNLPDVEVKTKIEEVLEKCGQLNFQDFFALCDSDSHILCFYKNDFIIDLVQRNKELFLNIVDYPIILINNPNFLNEHSFVCRTYDAGNFKLDYLSETFGIIPYEFANAWNDYSISCIFLQGNKVKKSFYDLFYFVLYKKLLNKGGVNQSAIRKLKQYAIARIKKGSSKLTFSSLPSEPQEVVPTPIALFYCIQLSSELFGEDYNLFRNEKLRSFCFTSQYIVEILKHYKMKMDKKIIKTRSETFVLLNDMNGFSKLQRLVHITSSIFQVQGGFIINKIVNPSKIHLIRCLYEDMNQVISFNAELTLENIEDEFIFFYSEDQTLNFQINERTCRPKHLVHGQNFYQKLLRDLHQYKVEGNFIKKSDVSSNRSKDDIDFSKLLSLCKIYIQYVRVYRKYPSQMEYQYFILTQKGVYRPHYYTTKLGIFPSNIFQKIKKVHALYDLISKKVNLNCFLRLTSMSQNVESKICLENSRSEIINDSNICDLIKE